MPTRRPLTRQALKGGAGDKTSQPVPVGMPVASGSKRNRSVRGLCSDVDIS
jgi:hypothetical protein